MKHLHLSRTAPTTIPHLIACFPGQPRQASTKKVRPVWIQMRQEMMRFGDAVALAGPYANNLHLTPDLITQFLQAGSSS